MTKKQDNARARSWEIRCMKRIITQFYDLLDRYNLEPRRNRELMERRLKEVIDIKYGYSSGVGKYKGVYICRLGRFYRVKRDPNDSYALHHGSFDSADDAKAFWNKHLEEKVNNG